MQLRPEEPSLLTLCGLVLSPLPPPVRLRVPSLGQEMALHPQMWDMELVPTRTEVAIFVQSAMDLSRGKITFCVYRGISEKGAENQALVVGHLK